MYALTAFIHVVVKDGVEIVRGEPEWRVYQAWLAAGNTPTPFVQIDITPPTIGTSTYDWGPRFLDMLGDY